MDIKNRQKRHRAPKHMLLDLKSEKSGNQVPNFEIFDNYLKFAHGISVQDGSYAFPNELMRFRFEAKPICADIQKHCNNAVIFKYGSDFLFQK